LAGPTEAALFGRNADSLATFNIHVTEVREIQFVISDFPREDKNRLFDIDRQPTM
jgi:hypothetical protein